MIIESLQQYLNLIDLLKEKYTYVVPSQGNKDLYRDQMIPPDFIFRGHSNHEKFKLIPAVFRWIQKEEGLAVGEFSDWEHMILFDFISEACGVIKDIPVQEIVPWLETAPHFGVPTRLLDFTSNPLVALYFACTGAPDVNASVWVVNKAAYNRVFYGELCPPTPVVSDGIITKICADEIVNQNYQPHTDMFYYHQYPWIYKPFYRNERMKAQSSIFMLWAAHRGSLEDLMQPNYYMTNDAEANNQKDGILCSVVIPADKKQLLLKELDMCGINEKFIYPGIDGIGRYIRKKYSYSGF